MTSIGDWAFSDCTALTVCCVEGSTAPASPEPSTAPDESGLTIDSITEDTAQINLTAETIAIPETFKVQVYSIDNGTKWKKWPTKEAALAKLMPKLLNKALTLHLSDQVNGKGKIREGDWMTVPEAGLPKPSAKTTYFVRTKAKNDGGKLTPACKTMKVSVK